MKQYLYPSSKAITRGASRSGTGAAPVLIRRKASESGKIPTRDVPSLLPGEVTLGKTAILPKLANGSYGDPVPMYQLKDGQMSATPGFEALAQGDAEVSKLHAALELAMTVQFAKEGLTNINMMGLQYWLTSPDAIPTLIVFSSMLEPETPAQREANRTSPQSTSAATMYNAYPTKTFGNVIDWSLRGTSDDKFQKLTKDQQELVHDRLSPTVKDAFDKEFKGVDFKAKNLMLFDREEAARMPLSDLAKVVFHEFFVHLSVPESYKDDAARQKASYNTDFQHSEEKDLGWDARFERELGQ